MWTLGQGQQSSSLNTQTDEHNTDNNYGSIVSRVFGASSEHLGRDRDIFSIFITDLPGCEMLVSHM